MAEDKFWTKLDNFPDPGKCWNWKGYVDKNGYGRIVHDYRTCAAHRIAWKIKHGDPGASHVLHKCDNPPCCNPDHLFLGNQADNIRDMIKKGRKAKPKSFPLGHKYCSGSNNPRAKLTQLQVNQIRILEASGFRQYDLCKMFGVSKSAISHIIHRRNWA